MYQKFIMHLLSNKGNFRYVTNMQALHRSLRELLNDCMIIMFVCGTIGIALKFITFFDQWVYFPAFPNALDSLFLISSVIYLTWKSRTALNSVRRLAHNEN